MFALTIYGGAAICLVLGAAIAVATIKYVRRSFFGPPSASEDER